MFDKEDTDSHFALEERGNPGLLKGHLLIVKRVN